jgi:hypothetical protein
MNEDLRDWFGKGGKGGVGGGGWDEYNTKGERTGKCVRGDDDDGEGPKPKCLSKEKAAKMTKKEIAAAVKRKRKVDPVADRPGKGEKPIMSSNKIDEGKKQPDHEHSMARSELATIEKAVKRLKNKMRGEGNIEAWVQSKITKAADYIDSAADYLDSGEHNVHGSMDEAKKSPCWKGYRKKPGTADYEKGSCVKVNETSFEIKHTSSDVRRAKKAKKIDALARRGKGGEQITAARMAGVSLPSIKKEDISLVDKILLEIKAEVVNEENKPTNPKLWAKWKAKAKAKFDVYPSAYANGWAAKGYKSEGGEWKSVSENVTIEDANGNTFAEVIDLVVNEENDKEKYCKKCKKMEKRSECKYGPETWDKMTDDNSDDVNEAVRMPSKTGNIIMVNLTWRGKYYGAKLFFPFTKIPSRKEVQSEIEKIYPGSKVYSFRVCDYEPGQPVIQVTEEEKKNLNDPIRTAGENKKFKVYVKDPKTGNVKTVRFGDPNMEIKRDDPKRLKAFRSRHGCDTPAAKDKTTAKYWSCYQWRKGKKVDN